MKCGLLIGICILAVAVVGLLGFIAYWLLVKRKMLGVLRSICKCVKKEGKGSRQNFDEKRKQSLVVKQKPLIEMVEGSLETTSQRVPEQFRQKVDSESDTIHQVAAPSGAQFSRQVSNSDTATIDMVRLNSNSSSSSTGRAGGRKAPPMGAPPAPPPQGKKPKVNTEQDTGDEDDDDLEIIDNEVYGAI